MPHLLLRDSGDLQVIVPLDADRPRVTIGRGDGSDVQVHWDRDASRAHAELERVGGVWTISDDGLSRNGTFVKQIGDEVMLTFADPTNALRFTVALDEAARRQPNFPALRAGMHAGPVLYRVGDYVGHVLRIGRTVIVFRDPASAGFSSTNMGGPELVPPHVSDAQRRVLIALCRPYKDPGAFTTPATNQEIAAELFLSVEAVKTHLRALFSKFGVEGLPQNQKRAKLIERAFQTGLVTERDL